jgi:hypothetical protein
MSPANAEKFEIGERGQHRTGAGKQGKRGIGREGGRGRKRERAERGIGIKGEGVKRGIGIKTIYHAETQRAQRRYIIKTNILNSDSPLIFYKI